jgi:spore coat polysaccharide biosynthesis protein SpsF (cytidylyltransferase family)
VSAGPPQNDALAVVQARMTSVRLPGKVLADVGGEPMLALLLRRLGRASRVGRIVVATSDDPSDDPVAEVAAATGVEVHRGPLNDVLARLVGAAGGHVGPVVRITADCPLTDPQVVDAMLECFAATPGALFGSNVEERTYPDGLDVEVMDADALRLTDRLATDVSDREHVTPALRRRPELFPVASLTGPDALGHLRWTVDTQADLDFVRAVVRRLGPHRYAATMHEILEAILRPPSIPGPGGSHG